MNVYFPIFIILSFFPGFFKINRALFIENIYSVWRNSYITNRAFFQ